jgi:cytidylate kinase
MSATHDQIVRRDRDDSTVSEFMEAAPGVTTLDTTFMSFQQSVEAVLELVATQTAGTEPDIALPEGDRAKTGQK